MEKSLELFLLMTAMAQALAIEFTLRLSPLILIGAKMPTVLKFWLGFAVFFEGFVIFLVLGLTGIFNLSLSVHILAMIAGVFMLWFGRRFSHKALDRHFDLLEKKPNTA